MKLTNPPLKKIFYFIIAVFMFGLLQAQTEGKQYFENAKHEIDSMLSGKKPLDYERTVFITENAYRNNTENYERFQNELNTHQYRIMLMVGKINELYKLTPRKNILISKDSSNANFYRARANFAIFKYLTDTSKFLIDNTHIVHLPIEYSYNDPLATKTWENSQVINLLDSNKNSGNCVASTSLFKILSLRLQSNANLVTTQGHIFITHKNENGRTYNIELDSKSFPGTGSIEILTYTSDKAVRSGIAMRELNLRQSIALCLVNLAKSYEKKFSSKTDPFLLECAELALKYDTLNLNAMLLKAETLEANLLIPSYSFQQLKNTKPFLVYQNYIEYLHGLGYREMPLDMKNKIISAVTKDTTYKSLFKDNTYNPFSHINKNYNRTFSMSNGQFEEFDIEKPTQKYFRTVFDTKLKKILRFEPVDTLYNSYEFDPVTFAWQIDPLYKKYPFQSPYSAFNNSPILFNDPTGAEGEPANGGTLPEITVTAESSKVNSVGLTTDMLRNFARQSGITGTGINFNRQVGKRFEQMALIEFLSVGRQISHSTPERGEAYGVPTTIPDASTNINIFFSQGTRSGKTTVSNASLFEVKAYNGVLTLSTSRGQIKAIIDIAARANTALGGKPSAVTFITTSNTFIGADVIGYATKQNVNVFQSTAMYNLDDNTIFFSSPILKNYHEGDGSLPFSLEQIHFDYPTNYMSGLPAMPELPGDPDPEEVE